MRKISVVLALLVMAVSLQAGIMVSPSRTEVSLPAGNSFDGSVTVRNDNQVPITVSVSAKDWFVLPDNAGLKAENWLKIKNKEVSLEPGESKNIFYQVDIATRAQGSLVAMMSFVPQSESDQGVTLMVSVSVFVIVKGTEKMDWEISEVKINNFNGKPQFSAVVKNNGNVHLRPVGSVTVYSKSNIVQKGEFPEGRPVYPGMSRAVTASLDAPLKIGKKYTAKISLDCRGRVMEKEVNFKIDKKKNVIVY